MELGNWGLRYGVACSVVAGAVDRCNMLAGAGMDEKMACIEEKQVPRSYIRLHEKGGRFNDVPAHHL